MGRAAKLKQIRKLQKIHEIIKENLEIVEAADDANDDLKIQQEHKFRGELPEHIDSFEELDAYILDNEHFIEIVKIMEGKYLNLENGFDVAEFEFSKTRKNYAEEYKLIHKYMM